MAGWSTGWSTGFKPYQNDLSSFTSSVQFKNPYLSSNYSFGELSPDVTKSVGSLVNNTYTAQRQLEQGRSLLDRTLDTLMLPLYATAGVAKGLTDGGSANDITPWEGFTQGLRAGNPFGSGYENGEYTYSRVLEGMGWEGSTTASKIGRGTVGFALDILLDPTTYLTGGLSAVAKGTGRIGRGGETLTKMTRESALDIVENTAATRNIALGTEEAIADADKLAREYNRLRGIQEEGNGLTLSLGNFPFGDKIFGKFAEPSVTLIDDATLRRFGDETFAPVYAQLRDIFYNSDLGEKFSTRTPLYRLANEDPSKLYDFLKFVDYTKGLNLDKYNAEKLIRDKASSFNLTPAEQKQVLNALQDNRIWSKVYNVIKFGKTAEGDAYRTKLQGVLSDQKTKLDDLLDVKKSIDELEKSRSAEAAFPKAELDAIKKDYQRALIEFDTKAIKSKDDLIKYVTSLKGDLSKLDDVAAGRRFSDEIMGNINKSFEEMKGGNTYKLVDDLNNYLFEGRSMIGYHARDEDLIDIVKRLNDGDSLHFVRALVEGNPKNYSGAAQEMYSWVAKQLGYNTWEEAYKKPLKALLEKSSREGLDTSEYQKLAELEKLDAKRKSLLDEFREARTSGDVKNIIAKLDDQRAANEMEEKMSTWISGRRSESDLDQQRAKFNDDDYAVSHGKPKLYKDPDKVRVDAEDIDESIDMSDELAMAERMKNNRGRVTGNNKDRMDARWEEVEVNTPHGVSKELKAFEGNPNRVQNVVTNDDLISMFGQIVEKHGWDMNNLSKAQSRMVLAIASEMRAIILGQVNLKPSHRMSVTDYFVMTDKQKARLFKVATERVRERRDLAEFTKRKAEKGTTMTKQEFREKFMRDAATMKAQRDLAKGVTNEREALLREIEDVEKQISGYDDAMKARADERLSLIDTYKRMIDDGEARINEINKRYDETLKSVDKIDPSEHVKLRQHIRKLEDALADDDALETYVKLVYGEKVVDDAINANSTVLTALDASMEYGDRVKEIVKVLRGEFDEIAAEEIRRGKLSAEQVDAMLGEYVPHILTPEGARYFANLRELEERKAGLTQMLGFGTRFNPHERSRKVKELHKTDAEGNVVEVVKNPTIEQLNEHFSQYLKGKNAYVDNIADLYVARAMKHTELVYDDEYMRHMMDVFGDVYKVGDGVREGFVPVVNFGWLKKELDNTAARLLEEWRKQGDHKATFKQAFDSVMADAGLDARILSNLKTPMVELSKEQADALMSITPNFKVRHVNNAIVQKANQARKLQIIKDEKRILQIYDKVTHLLKLNMTTVMPSFHIRNKMANMFLNWLGVGRDVFDIDMQVMALKTVRAGGKDVGEKRILVNLNESEQKALKWNEMYELAKAHGVIDEGFFAKDIGANSRTTGILKNVPAKFDPTDSENFIPYRVGARIGNAIENSDRLVHFVALLKSGKTVDEAADHARNFLFDYSDLTRFEQEWMKRIIPFYTWLRKNGALQVEQLLEQPGKYQYVAKTMGGIEGMTNQEDLVRDSDVTPFARDWLQLPFHATNDQGRKEPIMLNPNMPFMDLARIPNPTDPLGSAKQLFTQSNPIIKVPVEQTINKNVFFDSEITDGGNELADRVDHVASQNAPYGAIKSILTSETGEDFLANLMNTFAGIKTMSYDVQGFKHMEDKKLEGITKLLEGMR